MFNWLKNFGKAVSGGTVGTVAMKCWKESVREDASPLGTRHHEIQFWQEVMQRFMRKWEQIHRNAPGLADRCAFYLGMLEHVLGSHGAELTSPELEQIGEFCAVAIVRNPQEAFLSDAERAAIVVEVLPHDFWAAAEINLENFDDWYFARTGKHRSTRRNNRLY